MHVNAQFGAIALAVFGWAIAAQPVAAQNATAAPALEEVVVSTRKRTENLQDVPLSVAVVTGESLQQRGLNSIESLQTVTSGLVIRKSPNNIATASLRGLGTGTGNSSFEQSVAAFLDGTYIGRGPEFNQALFDLERAEVIKGTQASLLAKNTSLGAISLVARKPGDVFGYDVVSSYEFELQSHLLEAGLDLPLSDNFKVRFSGQLNEQGGWVHNRLTGSDDPRTNSRAARVVAQWTPTESLEATLLYQTYRYKQLGQNIELIRDALGRARGYALAAGDAGFEINFDGQSGQTDPDFGASRDLTTGDRAIATLNYQWGDYTLTSVSSYSTYDQKRDFDTDFLPGAILVQSPLDEGNEQYSQEVRVTSPAGRRFDFVTGAFYLREDWDFHRVLTGRAPLVLTGSFDEMFAQSTEAYSVFGQGNFRVVDRLTASAGLRYTDESRDVGMARVYLVPGSFSNVVYPAYPFSTLDRSEGNLDGSAGLQYQALPGAMLYSSWSKGSKSGGFINSPTRPATSGYDQEVARTVEVGGKFSFDRGHLNVGLFNTDIDGFQQAVFSGSSFIIQARDARSRGIEAEGTWRILDGLTLTGTLTYADTERKDNGTAPIGAPEWSGNFNLGYTHDAGPALELTAEAGVDFRSWIFLTDAELTAGHPLAPASAVVPTSPGYGKLNARLVLHQRDAGWEVALVGRNLLDKRVLGYAIPGPFITGVVAGSSEMPRTIFLQAILRR